MLRPPVAAAAARNLGHLGGSREDRYRMRAIDLHSQLAMRHRSPASGATLRGLVYALGLARNDPMLRAVRAYRPGVTETTCVAAPNS